MTLVLSIHTNDTIWMLTDRRLSAGGRPIREDACKVMSLDATDGVALLGYAGIGATAKGMQPSDWMSNVLRGRSGTIHECLSVLADAAGRQLPSHLKQLPPQLPHVILAPAFIDGKLVFYAIDVAIDASGKMIGDFKRVVREVKPGVTQPFLASMTGSGAQALNKYKNSELVKIRKLAIKHDKGHISAEAVADELAKVNVLVHKETKDGTVGPNSIVVWRYNQKGKHKGGGGHQHYSGVKRDSVSPSIPIIGGGLDIRSIADTMFKQVQGATTGEEFLKAFDPDAIDAKVAKLPSDPDDTLR